MIDSALLEIHYNVITELHSRQELIRIADEVRPGRIQNVCEKRHRPNLNTLTPKLIMDYVYGIDCVVAPCGLDDPKRFGFDITSNPKAFEPKIERAKSEFQDLWKAIGLTKIAVVLFTTDETELGVGLIKAANLQALGEKIEDSVIWRMDESDEYVTSYIIDYDVAIKV